MVEDEITDGKRIAELLSSEVAGHENAPYDRLTVENADPDVEPTDEGAHAYDVHVDGERLASVYVMPDRARVELFDGLEAAEHEAEQRGLRTRPVGGPSPKLVVFVANGARTKRALDVLGAAVGERDAA
ncbi:MAG: hypothetical protein ABEH83_01300 [Halobacterium sp.]